MHAATLINQLDFTRFVLEANVEGISQEESLREPQPGGSTLNWVMGHILASRNHILTVLGRPPAWDRELASRYDRGAPNMTDPEEATPLGEMVAALKSSQETIYQGLRELPPERMAKKAPFSPVGNPEETVGSLLAGLVFHEAYHAGQVGLLRRLVGKAPKLG